MAVTLCVIMLLVIVERYANRTDTKEIIQKRAKNIDKGKSAEEQFFGQEAIFQRTTTARSMTVKLKTLKTTDLDMQDDSA